jgi:hypothetical protein
MAVKLIMHGVEDSKDHHLAKPVDLARLQPVLTGRATTKL